MALNDGTLNSYTLNSHTTNGGQPAEPLNAGLLIYQASIARTGKSLLLIRQESLVHGKATIPISQVSVVASKRVIMPINQEMVSGGQARLSIYQSSVPASMSRADIVGWSVSVSIDGVDMSTRLTGAGSIDAERGLSRVAEFSLVPLPGQIDILEFYRKPVIIDWHYHYQAGMTTERLFSGRILEPSYDADGRLLTMRCSDMLQERLDAMDQTGLDAEIGGYFCEAVYDASMGGWERAQIMALSQASSYDLDRFGQGRQYEWDDRSASLYAYASGDYVAGSVGFDQANAGDIHNQTTINFDYRFTRKRYRDYTYIWQMAPTVGCEFLANPFNLPQRSMIQQACETTSWTLEALNFVDLPKPQAFDCMVDGKIYSLPWGYEIRNNSLVPDQDQALLCQGFSAKFSKKWAQTVTERYEVTLTSSDSISLLGRIKRDVSGGLETEFDGDAWEQSTAQDRHRSGAVLSRTGDRIYDVDDETEVNRSEMELALATLKSVAVGEMLQAHRQNYISWDVMLTPSIERHHRAALTADAVEAEGHVYQINHAFSIDSGDAVTTITIDLSRIGATAAERVGVAPAIQPQTQPDTDVGEADPDSFGHYYGGSTFTHIGGSVISPPFDDTWVGFMTNYGYDEFNDDPFNPDAPTAEMYPVQFVLPTPAIESELRQSVDEAADPQTVQVIIPVDKLIYT